MFTFKYSLAASASKIGGSSSKTGTCIMVSFMLLYIQVEQLAQANSPKDT